MTSDTSSSILGHEKILKDFARLAKEGSLAQSFLFYGPEMVGKKTSALALAKFFEKGEFTPPHDGEILQDAMVVDINFMRQLDPNVSDSVGIDAAREIKNFLVQKPNVSSRRTLIIDDAELLTTEAQNALLKIVEEPPTSSLIIFVASDADSILPTILSRIQKIYFGTVATGEIEVWLGNGKADAKAIAKKSFGKPGLAWRLMFDEKFAKDLELAQKFLKTPPAARKDFIKEIIEPDDFNLRIFLANVILVLAWDPSLAAKTGLWHKTLSLVDTASNFGVNPRLQLENLLMG